MIKQAMINHFAGSIALKIRGKWDCLFSAAFRPETAGTVINDYFAARITTALSGHLCDSQKSFVDVGAHIGSVISEVKRNRKDVSIIAFEAIPDKARNLIRKFPDATVHSCAAGPETDMVQFYVDTKQSGYSSMLKPQESKDMNTKTITVQVKRLDDVISHNSVGLIKIDVEGVELGVLRGAHELIAKSRPVIMFESAPPQPNDIYSKGDMWEFFNERHYDLIIPIRVPHNGSGLTKEGFSESHSYPRRTTNYFAIPSEQRDFVKNCMFNSM